MAKYYYTGRVSRDVMDVWVEREVVIREDGVAFGINEDTETGEPYVCEVDGYSVDDLAIFSDSCELLTKDEALHKLKIILKRQHMEDIKYLRDRINKTKDKIKRIEIKVNI